jgi:hypothetical protein
MEMVKVLNSTDIDKHILIENYQISFYEQNKF